MATVIVCIIVFGAIGLDIWYLARQKKKGKNICGCDSGSCSGCSGNCGGCKKDSGNCGCH